MVEPQDAWDAAGAIVDAEFEEPVGFELAGGDDAEGFGAGEKEVAGGSGEGKWVGGGWGEREEVEGEELHVSGVQSVRGHGTK